VKSFKVGEIKEVIKSLLKKNKFKYSDLADHLECSEPTVKRILGAEELSLSRLLQICDFLKLSLSDLESLIQKEERNSIELSEKQQKFLVENRSYFAYLFEVYQGFTPEQIAAKYKLNAKSSEKYLINLEKFDLIKVTSKNKIRPFYSSFPHLGKGPLGTAYYRAIIDNAGAFLKDHVSDSLALDRSRSGKSSEKNGAKFSVQTMDISQETFKQAMKEFEMRLHELEKQANFEEKTKDKAQLKTAVVILGSALVDKEYKGLQTLQKSFGDVENL